MSTTLVETLSPHRFIHRVNPAQQSPQEPEKKDIAPCSQQDLDDHQYAAQLFHLASQHHKSEYNRLKFGAQGSTFVYIPLSIQIPLYFQQIVAHQTQSSLEQPWFYCRNHNTQKLSPTLGPCGSSSLLEESDIRGKISDAMTSPLETQPPPSLSCPPTPMPKATSESAAQVIKTSKSHPIHVSALIPPQHLDSLSAHLSSKPRRTFPTIFDVSPSHTLDCIILAATPVTMPTVWPRWAVPLVTSIPASPFLELHPVSEAIKAAISSGLASIPVTRKRRFDADGKTETSKRSAVNEQRTQPTPIVLPQLPLDLSLTLINSAPTPLKSQRTASTVPEVPDLLPTYLPNRPPTPLPSSHSDRFFIGNLFLSSCPGKKVRLTGPVKGRNTVCRDLATDLRRIWEAGVRCVICCLDDAELEFLGAPWPEYQTAANESGLDVLRIPTPEGFAPISPAVLDAHLRQVIDQYTLRGHAVLVHCRGGVGRAGLVAACWALRLGLCGWIETEVRSARGAPLVWRDTLQMVERAIAVVRRRRSVKAIETYEQVRFLADYVEYLRAGAQMTGTF